MYVLQNAFLNKSGQNKGRHFVDPEIFELTFKFTPWAKGISVALNKTNVTVEKNKPKKQGFKQNKHRINKHSSTMKPKI